MRENGHKSVVDVHSDELIADKPSWLDEAKFAKAHEAILKFRVG